VLPLRLYLTISLLVLLVVRVAGTMGSVSVDIKPPPQAEQGAEGRGLNLAMFGGKAGVKDGKFFCHDLPDWMCRRLQRRIDIDPKEMGQQFEALKERFLANLGSAMFVLLPSFALWLKLVYFNRRMRYTEHLVFALHVHAFWFLALALTLPDLVWLSVPAFVAVPWYTMLAMRRVYGGRRWPRFLRAGLVTLLYVVTLGVALGGVGMLTLLS